MYFKCLVRFPSEDSCVWPLSMSYSILDGVDSQVVQHRLGTPVAAMYN